MELILGCLTRRYEDSEMTRALMQRSKVRGTLIVLSPTIEKYRSTERISVFDYKRADAELLSAAASGGSEKSAAVLKTAFGLNDKWRSPGQARNLLSFLCLKRIVESGKSLHNAAVAFVDDDVQFTDQSVTNLFRPIIEGKADITYGPFVGKPPFPEPQREHISWISKTPVLGNLLFYVCNLSESKVSHEKLFGDLIRNKGRIDYPRNKKPVVSNSYVAGNSARNAEVLMEAPCETSLRNKGDDVLPGWLCSYGRWRRILFVYEARTKHLFMGSRSFGERLADMLWANDFENSFVYLLARFRLSERKKNLHMTGASYPMKFGKWATENYDLLNDGGVRSWRKMYYDRYSEAVNDYAREFGGGYSLPSFSSLVSTNNSRMAKYACLIAAYRDIMTGLIEGTH